MSPRARANIIGGSVVLAFALVVLIVFARPDEPDALDRAFQAFLVAVGGATVASGAEGTAQNWAGGGESKLDPGQPRGDG